MREIASYIADQPQKTFPSYYKSIEHLQNLIFNNSPEEAFNALTNIESIHFELSNNSAVKDFSKCDDVSDEQSTLNYTTTVDTTIVASSDVASNGVASSVSKTDVASTVATTDVVSTVATADVASTDKTTEAATNGVALTQSDDHELFFAPIPKVRGRPAATRQRAFKMFGTRTTKPSPLLLKTKECLKNSTMESAAQVQQNDSCKECGFVDPPQKRTKTIPWIQCDHCNSWYHSSCSGLNKKFKLSEQFMCKQCA